MKWQAPCFPFPQSIHSYPMKPSTENIKSWSQFLTSFQHGENNVYVEKKPIRSRKAPQRITILHLWRNFICFSNLMGGKELFCYHECHPAGYLAIKVSALTMLLNENMFSRFSHPEFTAHHKNCSIWSRVVVNYGS